MKIKISEVFTDAPGGRHIKDGAWSGEEFRQKFLSPAMRDSSELIEIDLDGTYGYATSFLEEAFGGLAREYSADAVLKRIKFISTEEPELEDRIRSYIKDAK